MTSVDLAPRARLSQGAPPFSYARRAATLRPPRAFPDSAVTAILVQPSPPIFSSLPLQPSLARCSLILPSHRRFPLSPISSTLPPPLLLLLLLLLLVLVLLLVLLSPLLVTTSETRQTERTRNECATLPLFGGTLAAYVEERSTGLENARGRSTELMNAEKIGNCRKGNYRIGHC